MNRGRRKGGYLPKELEKAFEKYLEKGNRAIVARELGISEMTLYRWSKRYKWKERLTEFNDEWSKTIASDVLRRRKSDLFLRDPF